MTTVESKKDAEKLSKLLLEKRLCACIQTIGPISSKYWWKGKITTPREYLILIKTKDTIYKKLEKQIKKRHSYDNPEIVALPSSFASIDYSNWVARETK